MAIKTLKDLYIHELKDLYDAEHQLTQALPKMADRATSPDLKQAFKEHLNETKNQIKRLEQVFEELKLSPERETCEATEGLVEETEELFKEVDDKNVLDAGLISAGQRVEHYEMAGYGAARTYAKLLGHEKSSQLLQETLDEEGDANKKLMTLAEKLNPVAKQ